MLVSRASLFYFSRREKKLDLLCVALIRVLVLHLSIEVCVKEPVEAEVDDDLLEGRLETSASFVCLFILQSVAITKH